MQKTVVFTRALAVAVMLMACSPASAQNISNREQVDSTPPSGLAKSTNSETANVVSGFHGLDALPPISALICRGSPGNGGMPVIFSTEIDIETMQAGDFQVVKQSGEVGEVHCVSVLPAVNPGELRTVLVIGVLGLSDIDPPVRVDIVGNLHSIDGDINYRGDSVRVTPLPDGPSMVIAEVVEDWTLVGSLGPRRARGTLCPEEGVMNAVRVTWAGGVTLENGDEPGDAERAMYRIRVQSPDGEERVISPIALADLGDGDNNHMLCLDTKDQPMSVSFPAGVFTDPNDDLNPATSVLIAE